MEIEEIIKGIIAVLIVSISIVSRLSRNKKQQNTRTANNAPTPQQTQNSPKRDVFAELIQSIETSLNELTDEGESQEVIIDEIAESRDRATPIEKKPLQQVRKCDAVSKNTKNRTFEKNIENNKNCVRSNRLQRKFNLRDAVIYSEILTPKFKQEELE